MKRLMTLFVGICLFSLYAVAGSNISVVQGDKKFFKNALGKAVLEFVWDGATYDRKDPLKNHITDLDQLKPIAKSGFTETFNEKCKTVKIVEGAKDADYKFTMQVKNMDRYVKVMGWVPGPATKVWGTLTITDLKTGNVCVVIEVNEVDGGANPSPVESFSDCFEELAKQVAKLK